MHTGKYEELAANENKKEAARKIHQKSIFNKKKLRSLLWLVVRMSFVGLEHSI